MVLLRMVESQGLQYLLLDEPSSAYRLLAGFTTRLGGVSPPPYSSLNIAFHVGDAEERVLENRRRLAAALGVDRKCMVFAEQVHSNRLAIVDSQHCGMGSYELASSVPGVDGLITSTAGVMLVLMFADCVPIILYSPELPVIAVVHAGWRGTASRVAAEAVMLIEKEFGVSPSSLRAILGPCIGPCCYEVSGEVANLVKSASVSREGCGNSRRAQDAEKGVRVDLAAENMSQLLQAGIPGSNVERVEICTSCHTNLFFSHRAECGVTGRFAAFAYILPQGL